MVGLAANCLPEPSEASGYRYLFLVDWVPVPLRVVATVECVAFHCTDLPYGRGAQPIENLILRGHRETVMTAYRAGDAIDSGPVYGKEYGIRLDGCKADIEARFVAPVVTLTLAIMAREPVPVRQVGDVAMFSPLLPARVREIWEARGC